MLERRRETFQRFFSERDPGLVLGDRVEVYTWSGFGVGRNGLVEIGDDVVLVGAQIMCDEHISIGARTIVSYAVTIADSDFHPHDPDQRRLDAIANAPSATAPRPPFAVRPVLIEEDVQIGMGAFILKGVRVGRGSIILPGTVVTSDAPPRSVVGGNPGRVIETAT